jgi:predicted transposase YdaD
MRMSLKAQDSKMRNDPQRISSCDKEERKKKEGRKEGREEGRKLTIV